MTFIAVGAGGSGIYQYQFMLFNGTSWSVAKPYGATNDSIWTWNTTGLPVGNYLVEAWVRSAGSTAAWEAFSTDAAYTLTASIGPISPATGVTLNPPSPASPQAPGASVTWTAVASGGSGNYQYEFWLFNGTSWSIAKPYGATNDNTWTWDTTGLATGPYVGGGVGTECRLHGGVRSVHDGVDLRPGSALPPVTSVTLTPPPSPASPQAPGASVLWTATASGGSGNYQYQFWLYNGTSWSIAKPYGATNDNTWTWNTTGLATGTYLVAGVGTECRLPGCVGSLLGGYSLRAPVNPESREEPGKTESSSRGGRGGAESIRPPLFSFYYLKAQKTNHHLIRLSEKGGLLP